DGLFSGYDKVKRTYDTQTWSYEAVQALPQSQTEQQIASGIAELPAATSGPGFAQTDLTLQHPRSVFQLMKQHYSRYTPEAVERITGIPRDQFLKVAQMVGEMGRPEKVMTI